MARGGEGNVDSDDFTIAIGRHIGRTIALYDDPKREGAADAAGLAFVIGKIRAKIVLVADGVRCGVDDADRIVVVVDGDERLSVGGNAQAAGVGPDTKTDALVVMAERDLRRKRPGAARRGVCVHDVVRAARSVKRFPVRRKDEAHMGVSLLYHLLEHGLGLVRARHIVDEDVLGRVGRVETTVRFVQRVLAGSDDRQRRAVRAELRSHRLASNEVGVSGQAWVEKLLNRAADERRRDELAGRQPHRIAPLVFGVRRHDDLSR